MNHKYLLSLLILIMKFIKYSNYVELIRNSITITGNYSLFSMIRMIIFLYLGALKIFFSSNEILFFSSK